MRAAILFLLACTPSDRTVAHALLDEGLDSVIVLGWAPSCAPARGAYFEARRPGGETVTGMVCCDRGGCEVVFTSP